MGASEIGVLPIRTVLVPTTVFAAGAASEVPLMVQGYSGQTGNLQEWRDSSGNLLSYVGPNGRGHFLNGVVTRIVAGAVSDGSFSTTPPDGTIAVDSTNNRIWVRLSGVWRYATLT